jgi:serine/threonine protein phosphatase PrpC
VLYIGLTFVRLPGVLAVTRSLGDGSMKELVVGNPYTTEMDLTSEDDFLILACDGVRAILLHQNRGKSWALRSYSHI